MILYIHLCIHIQIQIGIGLGLSDACLRHAPFFYSRLRRRAFGASGGRPAGFGGQTAGWRAWHTDMWRMRVCPKPDFSVACDGLLRSPLAGGVHGTLFAYRAFYILCLPVSSKTSCHALPHAPLLRLSSPRTFPTFTFRLRTFRHATCKDS